MIASIAFGTVSHSYVGSRGRDRRVSLTVVRSYFIVPAVWVEGPGISLAPGFLGHLSSPPGIRSSRSFPPRSIGGTSVS